MGRTVNGRRGEGRRAGVGPDQAGHVESAGLFSHELRVCQGPSVVTIAGLDAIRFHGANGDENDVGLFERFAYLDLAEAGEVAGVELADLSLGGQEER